MEIALLAETLLDFFKKVCAFSTWGFFLPKTDTWKWIAGLFFPCNCFHYGSDPNVLTRLNFPWRNYVKINGNVKFSPGEAVLVRVRQHF